MININEFSKLTTLMFAASLDQKKWMDFLEYLAQLTGVRTHMFGFDLEHNLSLDILSNSYDPDFINSYSEYYGAINPWVTGFFDQKVGDIISSEVMCPRSVIERSEFYHDWVIPQEDIVAGGGTILFKEESRMFVLGGNIRRKDEHVEQEWLELVKLISPHIQCAIEINRILAGKNINEIIREQGFDPEDAGALIVNNYSRIIYANKPAQQMLDNGQIIRSNRQSHVSFSDHPANTKLRKAIHSLNRMNMDVSSVFDTRHPDSGARYSCQTLRFDPRGHDISPFGILVHIQEPCLLLLISKVKSRMTSQSELVSRFGITITEAEVVTFLAEGLSPNEIAEKRETSINTVRNQLKSAMSKMEVNRQVDLVNLVLR